MCYVSIENDTNVLVHNEYYMNTVFCYMALHTEHIIIYFVYIHI